MPADEANLRRQLTDQFAQYFIDNANPTALWTSRETLPAGLSRVAANVVREWLHEHSCHPAYRQVMGISALTSLARAIE